MHTIEQNRQQDYERFQANKRFEEMTDIAERLGYPIDTTIHYEIREGVAYARTDTVERPFHNQTFQAWQRGQNVFTGDQAFEVERLRLEHEEALLIDSFGSGEMNGNVLIKFSKVPDDVVLGRTSIKGYRRDLQRSFVRIYYRNPEGVSCRLFTLDHNHQNGMKRVGQLIDIDTDRQSEIVLADRTVLHVPKDVEQFVDELTQEVIKSYDSAIYEQTGIKSSAGSTFSDQINAMQAVYQYPKLFAEHMNAISTIMSSYGPRDAGEALLESQRERMAAAVKLAAEGHNVSSTSGSEVTNEVANGNYGRECATATGMNQTQATRAENVWKQGECQVCFARTSVGSCMVCANCAAADDRGQDLLKIREQNLRNRRLRQAAETALQSTESVSKSSHKHSIMEARYGQKVRTHKIIQIGGQDTLVLNSAGEIIDKL